MYVRAMRTAIAAVLCVQVFSAPTGNTKCPCFIVGMHNLPEELQAATVVLSESITCDFSRKIIGNVPDVNTPTLSFSNINFGSSGLSPLEYAIHTFVSAVSYAINPVRSLEHALDLYTAVEAGIRSEGGGSSGVEVVRRFLQLQVAKMRLAKGVARSDLEVDIEELVTEFRKCAEAAGERRELIDQVTELTL